MPSSGDTMAPVIVAALMGEASEEELRALAAWRASDPENERKYHRFAASWNATGGLGVPVEGPVPSARTVVDLAGARAGGTSASAAAPRPLQPPGRHTGHRGRRILTVAGAAAVGVGIGLWASGWHPFRAADFQVLTTGEDEVATLSLADGSVVRLASRSRISFSERAGGRRVTLAGRAYFAITEDSKHPFTVALSDGEVEVLGTRFEVREEVGGLRVTVVEGEVRVKTDAGTVQVGADQLAQASAGEAPTVVTVDDVFREIGWLGGFLAFQSTPLTRVAEEFQRRFNLTIQITGEDLAQRTVTGWFGDQPPTEMIRGVCAAVGARCIRENDTVRMESVPRP